MNLAELAGAKRATVVPPDLDFDAARGPTDAGALARPLLAVVALACRGRQDGDRVHDLRFPVGDAQHRPEERAGLGVERRRQGLGAAEHGLDAGKVPPFEGGGQFRQHRRRREDLVDGAFQQQTLDHGQVDAVEQNRGRAMVEIGEGDQRRAVGEGRHQENAAPRPWRQRQARALQQGREPARLMGMDDRLGPARRPRGEDDAAPLLRGHRRQAREIAGIWRDLLDRRGAKPERREERRLGRARHHAPHAGKLDAVAALLRAHDRIERRLGDARHLDAVARPDRGDRVAQEGRDGLAGLQARSEQILGKPRRALAERAVGDLASAVRNSGQVAEGVDRGAEIARPGDRRDH